MIHVIEGGFLTTVQDAGRWGWSRFGIPPSGPMDLPAYLAANALVGNPENTAALEITLTGPHLITSNDCLIAVCGAEYEIHVGSLPVPTWHAVFVRRGYPITFGKHSQGIRCILAISGGIDVPKFLGSRSTYLKGTFGGCEGRALQSGDQLPTGQSKMHEWMWRAGRSVPPTKNNLVTSPQPIRVVLGPQLHHFGQSTIATFLHETYTISPSSDRMGYRLHGPALDYREDINGASGASITDGIVTGCIQVPPDGRPIVMMVDHQTTGGYPKIATVIQADLPRLAQLSPGDNVRFAAITLAEAHEIYIASMNDLRNFIHQL